MNLLASSLTVAPRLAWLVEICAGSQASSAGIACDAVQHTTPYYTTKSVWRIDFFSLCYSLHAPKLQSNGIVTWPINSKFPPIIWCHCFAMVGVVVRKVVIEGITVAVWTQKKIFPLLTRPQGSQGCQKITFYFSKMKLFSFCAKIALKRHKLQKPSKLKKKCQKNPVFLDFFKYSSIWGQS